MSGKESRVLDSIRALKETAGQVLPGLKNIGPQIGAEVSRLGTQGASELANVLYNGHGYVPYGQGQYRDEIEPVKTEPEKAREDEGWER